MEKIRVVIAEKDNLSRKLLAEALAKAGYLVIGEASDGLTALKKVRGLQPELVLLSSDLQVMSGFELAKIVEEAKLSAVVLITDYRDKEAFKGDRWVGPVLVKPFDEFQLISVVDYAFAAFNKMSELQKEINRLKSDLETRKVVEKAKGILMKKHGLTEDAAFKRIQQQSMKKRTTMKKISKAVITAYEM